MVSKDARELREQAKNSDEVGAMQRVGRYGYVVYGLFHVALAVLLVQLAFSGGATGEASTSGAMRTLVDQPFGEVIIWVVAIGLTLLTLWQLLEAVLDPDDDGLKGRLKAAGKTVGYGAIAAAAWRFAVGGGGGAGTSEEAVTARLLQLPLGRVLVGLVAVGILVVAGYHVYKGVTRAYMQDVETLDLPAQARAAIDWSGRIGYPAKGVAYGLIGVLFLLAAVTADSEDAGGLDEALSTLKDAPYGPYLIAAVGAGFGLFGVYCLARARNAGDAIGFGRG